MQELEDQLATIEKQIIIEKSKTQTKISREQIVRYYQDALRHKSKQLINILVKEIQLYNDKIKITFNSPLNPNPDNNQGCFHIAELKFKIVSQNTDKGQIITTHYLVS